MRLLFKFGNERIFIIIDGTTVKFGNTLFGSQVASIEGLKLNYQGVIREFPDLEHNQNWSEEAMKRFKQKIKSCKNEEEVADYLIDDLKKYGYIPYLKQKKGFRPEVIK